MPDNGVAKIGEKVVTQDQLNTRVGEIQKQLQGRVPTKEQDAKAFADFERQVLDYMVTLDIIQAKSADLKISVTDADVEKQLDQVKQMFQGDDAKFQEALKQQNLTLDQLKVNLREQEIIKRAIDAVTKDAKVTDDELKKYYDANKEEFNVDESRKLRHILVAPAAAEGAEATQAQWDAAKKEAEDLLKKVKNGGDFAAIAKESSDDPGSKAQGGDLGSVSPGMMVPEFDEAAFALDKGQISDLVKTQYGYHIIQATEVAAAKQLTFDEAKERIRGTLVEEKKKVLWEEWLADQKDALKVVVKEGMEPTTTTTGTGTTGGTGATGGTGTTGGQTTTTAK